MLFKRRLRFLVFVIACVTTGSCALLPDFGGDGMSNEEEANLNLQMGVRYMELNLLDVAQEKLEKAYDLDSGNPEILNALAIYNERVKNDEEAANFYQSAIKRAPDNYDTKNNYGRFLCERGQQEKGLTLLQESLESPYNKRSWLTLSNIGVCQLQRNDPAQAELYFRKALQINPSYTLALKEMAKISYNNQEFMSARAFLERYAATAKHTPETLWLGFQTERALGNQQNAEDYKERLIYAFPTSTEAMQVKSAISK
ncbi:type IV pilus biogenesis/stability protein PilW [Methylomonas sp. MgM2]